ncbi:carboxyvinyl-carboxyphosphonate phosphorylmutase [Janibacter sp. Soil728]|uniref:isocitrate lyase/PEP mutase family protein n=1 Tax=Janibacter sp. Soil728 TaxID=1736393 RepID=UPI0006FE71F6|nr:isocitrate lyase/PEP mutase family protein [Janibacter sp. Soil728]KRE39058.1 carboxyvinyl-carboxyphosphonate phosphorylmutase [Janibacter sp. Soil728]
MTAAPNVRDLPGLTTSWSAHERRLRLRERLAGEAFILPGVTDAMGAKLAERAGFGAVYATGAGLANAQYGLPDLGLVTLPEFAEHTSRIASAVDAPVIVDADTGFGGPLMAVRAARMLERSGASALQIEDQEMPKRCGHFDSHTLIPAEHMASKIAAVRQGLDDAATVVIARTDARSVHDIDEAIRRAHLYAEAGADVLFLEAPRTVEEMERVGRELAGLPLVVNVVEGGKTPELSLPEYDALGFKVVLFANFLMRTLMHAGQLALEHLATHGESGSYADRMVSWQERQAIVNLDAFRTAEAAFDLPWEPTTGVEAIGQ